MRRRYDHATAVPGDRVEALSRAITRCETVWRTARAQSDYPMLLPHLREVLGLTREAAAAKADRLGLTPYDALLDEYDPGRPSARIDAIFGDLESRSEEHTSELQSLMRISYAVFCLKKKKNHTARR